MTRGYMAGVPVANLAPERTALPVGRQSPPRRQIRAARKALRVQLLRGLPELSAPNAPCPAQSREQTVPPLMAFFPLSDNPIGRRARVHRQQIPWWATSKDDIHFNYAIAGGSMMAMGVLQLRGAAGGVRRGAGVLEASTNSYADGIHDKCDWDSRTKWRFPNGGVGGARSTLRGSDHLEAIPCAGYDEKGPGPE